MKSSVESLFCYFIVTPVYIIKQFIICLFIQVRELFRVADDLSPSIVFIDEIDAVGSKRYESSSGGTREIQRTMLELLNQLDGFDERGDVKVITINLSYRS